MTPSESLGADYPDSKKNEKDVVEENGVVEEERETEDEKRAISVVEQEPGSCELEESRIMLKRTFFKTMTYIGYDALGEVGLKDRGRVVKVLVESFMDETCPGTSFHDMSLRRKLIEYLIPCGVSSLVLYIARNLRKKRGGAKVEKLSHRKLAWVVLYRLARQAMIYRLFFRLGSKRYYFVTLVGLVCCFFKDGLFREIWNLRKWPKHFSASQGLWAVLRSIAYSAAFCLPLQKASRIFDQARRRANAKKFVFAVVFARAQLVKDLIASIVPVSILKT